MNIAPLPPQFSGMGIGGYKKAGILGFQRVHCCDAAGFVGSIWRRIEP